MNSSRAGWSATQTLAAPLAGVLVDRVDRLSRQQRATFVFQRNRDPCRIGFISSGKDLLLDQLLQNAFKQDGIVQLLILGRQLIAGDNQLTQRDFDPVNRRDYIRRRLRVDVARNTGTEDGCCNYGPCFQHSTIPFAVAVVAMLTLRLTALTSPKRLQRGSFPDPVYASGNGAASVLPSISSHTPEMTAHARSWFHREKGLRHAE